MRIQKRWRIDKCIAMDPAQAGKGRILQAWDHFEHVGLRAVFHLGLKPNDIIKRPQGIIASQLDNRIGFDVAVWIGQTDGLHGAKS